MKNRKGLSGIVTTLIIILLVLVAIGVIWTVVSKLLDNSTNKIEQAGKCLDIDIKATKVVETTNGVYNVTLKRSSTGDEGGVGATIVLYSADDNSEPLDFGSGAMLTPLQTDTQSVDAGITNATRIEVTPYFLNSETNKKTLCSTTTEFEFTTA